LPRQGKRRREYADIGKAFAAVLAKSRRPEPCSTYSFVPKRLITEADDLAKGER
jgi:hypothetical protein